MALDGGSKPLLDPTKLDHSRGMVDIQSKVIYHEEVKTGNSYGDSRASAHSNLSNPGGSGSDKEIDSDQQTGSSGLPASPFVQTTWNATNNNPPDTNSKQPVRKRKGDPNKTTPKAARIDRKMTDYIKGSPKTHHVASSAQASASQNGSSSDIQIDRTTATVYTRQTDTTIDSECKVESTSESTYVGEVKRLTDENTKLAMDLKRERALLERRKAKDEEALRKLSIGHFAASRANFRDQWQEGYEFKALKERWEKINQARAALTNANTSLRKRRVTKESRRSNTVDNQASNDEPMTPSAPPRPISATLTDDGFLRPEPPKEMSAQDVYEQEEINKLLKEQLKREEAEYQADRDRLERERDLHIRRMKRIQYEEQSHFRNFNLLHNRYLPLSMLGRGGFSEVWKTYDLERCEFVACKIHHVNRDWTEEKKASYVKHAMREKDIHKSLIHPRIVRLYDLFTIDNDSFCTVLEYCDGNDLDLYLKMHKTIPEKEARVIIMQVVAALKYLNERKNPVIHYDLKPANILLKSGSPGEIKITDFGLSKTMDNSDDGQSIELTSQGAGTYWYLPPETFQHYPHEGVPKINSKVDVWSVGVIFYQCLYGKRPFGNDRTQLQILEERTILSATQVEFPNQTGTPKVSPQAQDFIRACLQYNKSERVDVLQLAQHEYLKRDWNKISSSM
ncbi:BMA-TLK-1, isoform e [Aphelenchoides besseyi]|nr:BMA-TLK-1, isoform e [Aphelenchoides besseyi]